MSRGVTLAGYACLLVMAAAYQLVGVVRRRTATLGQALRTVTRSIPGRLAVLVLWLWIGWHLFVRGGW